MDDSKLNRVPLPRRVRGWSDQRLPPNVMKRRGLEDVFRCEDGKELEPAARLDLRDLLRVASPIKEI